MSDEEIKLKLGELQMDFQEKISKIKKEYELKIKGIIERVKEKKILNVKNNLGL